MNLFHYCSNSAFVSIVESRSIWLSDLSLSSDELEGKWIRRVFSKSCEKHGLRHDEIDDLMQHLDNLIAIIGGAGFCLSQKADLLSQWRGYADGGCGVSIGFDKGYLERLSKFQKKDDSNPEQDAKFGFVLQKVEYNEKKQSVTINDKSESIVRCVSDGALRYGRYTLLGKPCDEEINRHKEAYNMLGIRMLMLLPEIYTLKNPAFSEEKEWRLIAIVPKGYKEEDVGMLADVNYRATTDKVVPFIPVELCNINGREIREVILGPRNRTPVQVVHGLLKKNGFEGVSVRRSEASYR